MADTTVRVGTGALVGHRLTRRIGSDSRAEVFLAQASTEGRSSVPVVLKVFRHGTDPTGIGREVHAMLSSAPGALPRLDDVATTPDGRVCLVLAHLPGLALNRLLAVRGRIGAAEVVTVAATATACLQAVHDVGLSLPLVRPSGVRFDDRGRPVLLGLGSLADLPGGVAGVATRRDDAVGLARFLHALLEFLDPDDAAASRAPALVAEFESAVLTRPFPATLVGLEAALFAWAPAGPVRGAVPGAAPDAETGMVADVVPRAMNAPAPAGRPRLAPVSVSASAAPAPAAAGSGLPVLARVGRWVGGTPLGSAARNVVAQAGRLGSFRRRERGSRFARLPGARPLLLAAGLAAVISVGGFGALSLLPGEGAGGVVASPPASDPAATDPDGTGADGTGADGADPSTSDPSILEGDDPAAAVLELLRLRDVCLAHVSVLCLDGVDQHGSVAMAADGYRIRQLQGDDARTAAPDAAAPEADPLARFTARVQEHTGNSALVVLEAGAGVNAQPASALVIKGEAGWRLRELFDY